jgi:hypothetical protein
MKCDEDLYAVGLIAIDVNKPLNKWKKCKHIGRQLMTTTLSDVVISMIVAEDVNKWYN